MPNPRYTKGRAGEYYIERQLEKEGYIVKRFPASQGAFDIIAAKQGKILLIQVKATEHPYLSKAGKEERLKWVRAFGGEPSLARKRSGRWVLEPLDFKRYADVW